MPGGWSPYGPLTPQDQKVFEEATAGLLGVRYVPEEVSRQVVAGMNYRFRCKAEPLSPGVPPREVLMQIHAPLDGKPLITGITDLGHRGEGGLLGGWTPLGPLTPQDRKVFERAMAGLEGVEYTPREVSTQIVAGKNYRFLCDAKVVSPGSQPHQAIVMIYAPLEGDPVITGILQI